MGKQHKGTRAPHRGSTGSEVTPPPPPSTGAAPGRTSSQSGGQRGCWTFCRVTAGSHVGTETGAGPRGQGARSAFRDADCLDLAAEGDSRGSSLSSCLVDRGACNSSPAGPAHRKVPRRCVWGRRVARRRLAFSIDLGSRRPGPRPMTQVLRAFVSGAP